MKVLIINGPNLNMLGIREPNHYGKETYRDLKNKIKRYCKSKKIQCEIFQSNFEGEIVNAIHKAYKRFNAIVINPAAYTHTSIAILDALKSVNIPTVEVHISKVLEREDFRKISYISYYAEKVITGEGTDGYLNAIDYLSERYDKCDSKI